MSENADSDIFGTVASDPQAMNVFLKFAALEIALSIWVLTYLFFFSKVNGFFLSLLLNFRSPEAVNIRIGSIHIGLLGGNLTIRGLKYSSKNIIVRAADVTLSMSWWREWSKCRAQLLRLKVSGLEYCIVNNEARYNDLKAMLDPRQSAEREESSLPLPLDAPPPPPALFWLTQTIGLEIAAASVMIGNSALKTMLVVAFSRAAGSVSLIDRGEGCNRVSVDVHMYNVSAKVKNNSKYEKDSAESAKPKGLDRISEMVRRQRRRIQTEFNRRIHDAIPSFQFFSWNGTGSSDPADGNEETGEAREDNLLLSPLIHLNYYMDLAGYIDDENSRRSQPPMTGVVLNVAHGVLTYGPWEDRQRAAIQRWLLPADFQDRKMHTSRTGYLTQHVGFHTKINFRGSVVLRLPFSKDLSRRKEDYGSSSARNADEKCGPALLTVKAGQEQDGMQASRWGIGDLQEYPAEYSGDSEDDDEASELEDVDESMGSQDGSGGRELDPNWQAEVESSSSSWTTSTEWGSDDSDWEDWGKDSKGQFDLEEMPLVGKVDVYTPFLYEEDRYEIVTEVQLESQVTIASSIRSESNNGVLWECDKLEVHVSQGGGLRFNDFATMDIKVFVGESTVRLLRDHTFLITSLLADWGWQQPMDESKPVEQRRLYFVPSATVFKLTLAENFKVGLLVNQDNVIDDFAADDDNNVLWVRGSLLEIVFDTPRRHFQPKTMLTKFHILLRNPDFDLHPRTSDNDFHAPLKSCIKAEDLSVVGELSFCQHDKNFGYVQADSSVTSVTVRQLQMASHGVVLRAFLNMLDNYFGASFHVITSTEYMNNQNQNRKKKNEIKERYQIAQTQEVKPNQFNVQVRVALSDVTLILPNHSVVTCRRPPTARATTREVLVDMSSTSIQSDLVVTVAPIAVRFPLPDKSAPQPANGHVGSLYIDGVDYHDLSYNGPPPLCESYRTISTINVGEIRGSPTAMDIRMLSNFVAQLGEQGPRLIQPLDDEVPRKWWMRPRAWNSRKISVRKIGITASGPACLVEVSLPLGLEVRSGIRPINRVSHDTTRIRLNRLIASLNVVPAETVFQHRRTTSSGESSPSVSKGGSGFEVGRLQTSITIELKTKYSDWERDQLRQYRYLTRSDHSSHRLNLGDNLNNVRDDLTDSDSDSGQNFPFFTRHGSSDMEGEEYPDDSNDELTFVTASSQGYDWSDDASFVTASDGEDAAFEESVLLRQASFRSAKAGSFRSKPDANASKANPNHSGGRRKSEIDESMADVPFAFIARRGLVRTVVPSGSQLSDYASLQGRQPVNLCMISNRRMLKQSRDVISSAPATPRSGAGRDGRISPAVSSSSFIDMPWHHRSASQSALPAALSPPGDVEVAHTVEIDVHGLIVQLSPLSLDALSAMVESVPPLSRTAEGCVDLLSGLNPKESMSYAFAGPHKVVNILRIQASFAELQLLQRLPPDSASARPAANVLGADCVDGGELSILNVAAKGVKVEKMSSKTMQGPKPLQKQRVGSEVRLSLHHLRDHIHAQRHSAASLLSELNMNTHAALESTASAVPLGAGVADAHPQRSLDFGSRSRNSALRGSEGLLSREFMVPTRQRDSGMWSAKIATTRRRLPEPVRNSAKRRRAGEDAEPDKAKSGEFNIVLNGFMLWVCRLPDWRSGGRDGGVGCGLGQDAMAEMLKDSPFISKPPRNVDVITIAQGHGLVARFRADDHNNSGGGLESRTGTADAAMENSMPQAAKLMGTKQSHMLLRLKVDPVSVLVCTAAASILGPSTFLWMEVYNKLQLHVDRRRKVVKRNVRMIYDLVANKEEGKDMLSKLSILAIARESSRIRRASLASEKLQANRELSAARNSMLLMGDSFADSASGRNRRMSRMSRKSSTRSVAREDVLGDGALPFPRSLYDAVLEDNGNEVGESRSVHRSRRKLTRDTAFQWTEESIRQLAIAVAGSNESVLEHLDKLLQLPFDAKDAEKEKEKERKGNRAPDDNQNAPAEGGWRLDLVATVGEMMVHFVPTDEGHGPQIVELEEHLRAPENRFGFEASSVSLSPSHVAFVATNLRRSTRSMSGPLSEIGGVVKCEKCRVAVRPPFIVLVSEAVKGFSNVAMQQAKDIIQRRREIVGTHKVFAAKAKQPSDARRAPSKQPAKKEPLKRLRSNSIMDINREEVGWFEKQRRLSESFETMALQSETPKSLPGTGNGAQTAAPVDEVIDSQTMMHIQVEVGIDIDALVPTGKLTLGVGSCVTSYTLAPPSLSSEPGRECGAQSTACVSVENVSLQAVPTGAEADCPKVTVSNVRVSYMSTTDCPALEAHGEGTATSVKDMVHRSKHTFSSLFVNIDGVVSHLNLPKLNASSIHMLLAPWLHELKQSKPQARGGEGEGVDVTQAESEYFGENHITTMITTVAGVTVHLQVLPWVQVHYENPLGLYVDVSQYTFSPESGTTLNDSPLSFARSSQSAVRKSSELSFKLHQGRIWTEKDGDLVSKNEMYLPKLQGHGKVQAKGVGHHSKHAASERQAAGQSNPTRPIHDPAPEVVRKARSASILEEETSEFMHEVLEEVAHHVEEELETVTNVEMMLYMKEMVNEVNEEMLNSLLEIQRTMTTEINMMLKNAGKALAKQGEQGAGSEDIAVKTEVAKRSGPSAASGPSKEFCLFFLLQGFKLRVVAPSTSLLLDTGFVKVKVAGSPKVKAEEHVDLMWNLTLKGLSLVATSPTQCPVADSISSLAAASGQATWVLAQLRTDLSVENSNFAWVASSTETEVEERQSKFRVLFSNNKVMAHPGFLKWIESMIKHFTNAFSKYQQERERMDLDAMDKRIFELRKQLLKQGTTAVQGSIPEVPQIEILMLDTCATLFFDQAVPERFCYHVPSKTEDIFETIKLGEIDLGDVREDKALIASVGKICVDAHPAIKTKSIRAVMPPLPPYSKGSERGGIQILKFVLAFSPDCTSGALDDSQRGSKTGDPTFRGLSIESIEGVFRGRVRDVSEVKRAQVSLHVLVPSVDVAVDASTVASLLSFANRWGASSSTTADPAAQALVDSSTKRRQLSFAKDLTSTPEQPLPTWTAPSPSPEPAHETNQQTVKPQITILNTDVRFEVSGGSIKVYSSSSMDASAVVDSRDLSSPSKSKLSSEKRGSFRMHKPKVLLEIALPCFAADASASLLHTSQPAKESDATWMQNSAGILSVVQLGGQEYTLDRNFVCVRILSGKNADGVVGPSLTSIQLACSPDVLVFVRDVTNLIKQHSKVSGIANENETNPSKLPTADSTPQNSRRIRRVSSLVTASPGIKPAGPDGGETKVFKNETCIMLTVAPIRVKLLGSTAQSRYAYLDSHMYHQAELHLMFGNDGEDGSPSMDAMTATALLSSFPLSHTSSMAKAFGPYELRNVAFEVSSMKLSLWPSIKDQVDHLTLQRIMLSMYFLRKGQHSRELSAVLYIDHVAAKVDLLSAANGTNIAQDWKAALADIGDQSQPERDDKASAKSFPKGHKYCAKVGSWDIKVLTPLGTANASTSSDDEISSLVLLASLGEMRSSREMRSQRFSRTSTTGSFRATPGKRQAQDSILARLRDCRLDLERQKHKQYGCVEGGGGLPRAFLQSSALRHKSPLAVDSTKENTYNVKGLRFAMRDLDLLLQYDQSKVLALHADKLDLDSKAVFLRFDGGKGVKPGIDVALEYQRLVVQVCSSTVPNIRRIVQRLATAEAVPDLTRAPSMERATSSRLDTSAASKDKASAKGKVDCALEIEACISGEELHVTMYADDFDDDGVHLTLRELKKLRLNRLLDQDDLFHSLQIQIADCIMFKVARGSLPMIHKLSLSTVRGASAQYVVCLYDMAIDLDTVQRLENRLAGDTWHITWDLLSEFRNPIDISPDLAVYTFVQRLLTEDYASSIASSATNNSAGNVLSPMADSKPSKSRPKIEYKLNLFDLHPKFGPLGDMTPDVSRVLGWVSKEKGKKDQDKICDSLRTFVVENLETVCHQLASAMDTAPPRRVPGIVWSESLSKSTTKEA